MTLHDAVDDGVIRSPFFDDTLECPYCDCPFVHHARVETWEREEDGPTTKVIIRGGVGGAHVEMRGVPEHENPSARRDAVEIRCFCEWGHNFGIQFIQHKGTTFLTLVRYEDDEREEQS